MKFKLNLFFRRFNKPGENKDSGYYDSLDRKGIGKIDINLDDPPFEEALTIYHEVTHMLFDFFTKYRIDDKNQKVIKRDKKLREDWRKYNEIIEKGKKSRFSKEERICYKVEKAVKAILKKEIPKNFFNYMFTTVKKSCRINKRRKFRC